MNVMNLQSLGVTVLFWCEPYSFGVNT